MAAAYVTAILPERCAEGDDAGDDVCRGARNRNNIGGRISRVVVADGTRCNDWLSCLATAIRIDMRAGKRECGWCVGFVDLNAPLDGVKQTEPRNIHTSLDGR